jgi:hypothetical protein
MSNGWMIGVIAAIVVAVAVGAFIAISQSARKGK